MTTSADTKDAGHKDLGLPWAWRPLEYDDWGTIRDAHGSPVCDACRLAQYTDLEADEARRTKTVPPKVEAIAKHIIASANSHAELLEALKALHERYVMAIGNEGPEALAARAAISRAEGR